MNRNLIIFFIIIFVQSTTRGMENDRKGTLKKIRTELQEMKERLKKLMGSSRPLKNLPTLGSYEGANLKRSYSDSDLQHLIAHHSLLSEHSNSSSIATNNINKANLIDASQETADLAQAAANLNNHLKKIKVTPSADKTATTGTIMYGIQKDQATFTEVFIIMKELTHAILNRVTKVEEVISPIVKENQQSVIKVVEVVNQLSDIVKVNQQKIINLEERINAIEKRKGIINSLKTIAQQPSFILARDLAIGAGLVSLGWLSCFLGLYLSSISSSSISSK